MNTDNDFIPLNHKIKLNKSKLALTCLLASSFLISCASDDGSSEKTFGDSPTLELNLPASLTGGTTSSPQNAKFATTVNQSIKMAKSGTGQPCAFIGQDDEDDPFRNGYETSKFMISTMATWTCVADLLIDVSKFVPHNGKIIETDNDNNSDTFEEDEPTHYSVTDESETQVTVRLYYNYSRSQPPIVGEQSQFYTSWNEASNGDIEGRMIIDGSGVNWDNHDSDDPSMMRMDFDYTDASQTADMFLQFDENNPWADGFRIQIVKDLLTNPLLKVFQAKGLLNMNAQFNPLDSITEVPDIHLFTVSDALGNGATIAEFQNVSLPFVLNEGLNNYLGDYLFTKKDVYYFEDDMDWDYINKTIDSSEYRGNRTTAATGGTWLFPFNPSLDLIITELDLGSDYFTGAKCANVGNECDALANKVHDFIGGFADMEQNQGTDPLDWRSTELTNPDYLTTVYPNGIDWTGAFDHVFVPE